MSKNKLNSLEDFQEEINNAEIKINMKPNPEKNCNEVTRLLSVQELKKGLASDKSEGETKKDKSTATYFHVEIF